MAVWELALWQARLLGAGPGLAALGWLAGLGLVFGTEHLPAAESAWLLEGWAPVSGVFLCIGLFAPEREHGLRDCAAARRAPYLFVCALRAGWQLLAAAALAAGYTAFLAARGCAAGPGLAFAFFANAVFLGGLALVCATVLGGAAAGALPPLAWVVLDAFGGMPGSASLLRCARGAGLPKGAVCAAGLALLAAAFWAKRTQMRRA